MLVVAVKCAELTQHILSNLDLLSLCGIELFLERCHENIQRNQ